MFEQDIIKHHIGMAIIKHLQKHEFARFSELRPKNIDTNLFTYHLKSLMKSGHITKTESGYTLGRKGLLYVDRVSAENMKLRTQPKIITMLFVSNGDGKILLHHRRKQPYINTWTLPYGKIHINDRSVEKAAVRESEEKLHYTPARLQHVGDCYIVVSSADGKSKDVTEIESRTLAHIVCFEANDIVSNEQLHWVESKDLKNSKLAPAVEEIIDTVRAEDTFFFKEFNVTFL